MIGGIVIGFVLASLALNAVVLIAISFEVRGRDLEKRVRRLEHYVDEIAEHPALSVPQLPPRDDFADPPEGSA